jgi:hypothetical protein
MPVHGVNVEATRQMWDNQDRHALSIGRLCMAWAALDMMLDDLFEPMLRCSPGEVASIITNVENISGRCDILKRLLTIEAPSETYRTWLIGLLNRVSTELAPLRNRYIHDRWVVTHEKTVRTDKRAKIQKAQSFQTERLLFDTEHVTVPTEVDKLTQRTTLVLAMLSFAEHDLRVWRRTGRILEPQAKYVEASKPNARWRTPEEHKEAIKQGRPASDFVFD